MYGICQYVLIIGSLLGLNAQIYGQSLVKNLVLSTSLLLAPFPLLLKVKIHYILAKETSYVLFVPPNLFHPWE